MLCLPKKCALIKRKTKNKNCLIQLVVGQAWVVRFLHINKQIHKSRINNIHKMTMRKFSLLLCIYVVLIVSLTMVANTVKAQQCGRQGLDRPCPNNLCCSQFGFCGSTYDYCSPSENCQFNCWPPAAAGN